MPRRHALIVYILYLPLCIYLFRLGTLTYPDTETYFDAWYAISRSGIDVLRTPLYPIFLGLIECVVGAHYCLDTVAICQMLIFGVSIPYFYKAAYMLTASRKLCLLATLWYALSPSCSIWLTCVLTESLSISLMTIFVYLTIRIWRYGATRGLAIAYGVMLTLLLMLRPSFVYLIPVALIMCALYYARHKVIAKGVLISVIVPTLLLMAYCGVIYSRIGVFTPSMVSINNKIAIFRQSGITDFDHIQDPELRADMANFMSDTDGYETMNEMIEKYGLMEMYALSSDYATSHPALYVSKAVGRFYKLMYSDFMVESSLDAVLYPLVLKGKGIITICLVYLLAIVYVMRKRHLPYLSIILLVMALGNISVTILGADNEFLRLVSVSMPLYMLFTVQIIRLINKSKHYTEAMP